MIAASTIAVSAPLADAPRNHARWSRASTSATCQAARQGFQRLAYLARSQIKTIDGVKPSRRHCGCKYDCSLPVKATPRCTACKPQAPEQNSQRLRPHSQDSASLSRHGGYAMDASRQSLSKTTVRRHQRNTVVSIDADPIEETRIIEHVFKHTHPQWRMSRR